VKTKTEIFPLADAQLAVDIAAVRDQLGLLCARVRSEPRYETVLVRLSDALTNVFDALSVALTVEKP
jgi:hypothetical protein